MSRSCARGRVPKGLSGAAPYVLVSFSSLGLASAHARRRPPHPRQLRRPRRCARLRAAISGRKRTHDAGEMMAAIVAKRLVEHLERSGFVVMKKPPIGGGAAIGRGHDGR